MRKDTAEPFDAEADAAAELAAIDRVIALTENSGATYRRALTGGHVVEKAGRLLHAADVGPLDPRAAHGGALRASRRAK